MIALHGVGKRYGEIDALENISLEVPPGERMAILGPSGSGKTTLLRLIAGLELPTAGEIAIGGKPASHHAGCLPPHLRGMGFLFQTPSLWPHMTVAENITFGLHRLSKHAQADRLDELIEQVSLQGLTDRYPSQLSGGEARRASLARTLAPRPARLLMDEPLTHLDSQLKGQLFTLIQEIAEQDAASLIYVTHEEHEAEAISNRVVRLEAGRLLS